MIEERQLPEIIKEKIHLELTPDQIKLEYFTVTLILMIIMWGETYIFMADKISDIIIQNVG